MLDPAVYVTCLDVVQQCRKKIIRTANKVITGNLPALVQKNRAHALECVQLIYVRPGEAGIQVVSLDIPGFYSLCRTGTSVTHFIARSE